MIFAPPKIWSLRRRTFPVRGPATKWRSRSRSLIRSRFHSTTGQRGALPTRISTRPVPFYQHDMTPHVRGHHQFLLKFSVENTTEKEILAFDKWVIAGKTSKKAEKQKRPRKDGL